MRDFTRANGKLVDPVHFFSERGESLLTVANLTTENERLETENGNLRKVIRSLTRRLSQEADDGTDTEIAIEAND